MSNFMKIRPVGAELFHADGRMDRRTGMSKPIVAFPNIANVPTKTKILVGIHSAVPYCPCG